MPTDSVRYQSDIISELQIIHHPLKTDELSITSPSSKSHLKAPISQFITYIYFQLKNHLIEIITYQHHQMIAFQYQENTGLVIKPQQLIFIEYPYSSIHENRLTHLS